MINPHTRTDCHRDPAAKENLVSHAGLDADEIASLGILRCFISTFAEPQSQNWMKGFELAGTAFGAQKGPVIAALLLDLLQAIRRSRQSVFMFSNPNCAGCARILTEHERRLISAINTHRRRRPQATHLQLMMLCEGNSTETALETLDQLTSALGPLTGSGPLARGMI